MATLLPPAHYPEPQDGPFKVVEKIQASLRYKPDERWQTWYGRELEAAT